MKGLLLLGSTGIKLKLYGVVPPKIVDYLYFLMILSEVKQDLNIWECF